jgi:hypothetical protein
MGVDGRTALIKGVDARSDIPGNPKLSYDSIDYTNSQLSPILTSEPNSVNYDMTFTSTPIGASDLQRFFLRDTSKIVIKSTFELPMIFSVFDYELKDTTALDLGISSKDEDTIKKSVEKAQLKLVFETQLPFDVKVQGYLLDSNNNVLDKIFDGAGYTVLANTDIAADGSVRSVKDVITYIELDSTKFSHLIDARKIAYQVNGSTSNAKLESAVYVKLKSDYVFGIRAGILAKVNYDIPIIEFK